MSSSEPRLTFPWIALIITAGTCTAIVVLILLNVVGPGLWFSALAMALIAVSNGIMIFNKRKRREEKS
ncbi:hypothetical protein [Microbacterium marinilacus]|uniref:Uncharacterized protein n=1 Tax=Microbacterium marinilacus TaxID=415209 RepID=A0ABP7B1B0_9MICO|nr:hypothetical protein [Microbacterium marinilacus]MBY0688659.1 hypothetical protein [Microbacterium marinilacus]